MPPSPQERVVRFGSFEVDLGRRELRENGRRLRIQEQPFSVLAHLLDKPGEVVTRDELRALVWPADTYIEFDQGLNTAIKKLRQVLGDSAESPLYIRTIPRRGYSFIAPLTTGETTEIPPASNRFKWLLVGSALALTGAAVYVFDSDRAPPADRMLAAKPLTAYRGEESSPSFSPAGDHVAFAWRKADADNFDVYVKQIGASEPLRLTSDPAHDYAPSWSPDGRSIAFLRSIPPGRTGIFVMPAIGGTAFKVAEVAEMAGWGACFASQPAWHPDGRSLVFMDQPSPDEPFALFSFSLGSREKKRITSASRGDRGDNNPAVSPDGKSLAFIRYRSDMIADLYRLELPRDGQAPGKPTRLTSGNDTVGNPAWTPDGRSLVYSGGSDQAPSLWKMTFDRQGQPRGRPQRLTPLGDGSRMPTISRNGRLVYMRGIIDIDIWRLGLAPGQSATSGTPLVSSTLMDHSPHYSPDGKRIAYASNQSGANEIWICNSDGTSPVQLTKLSGSEYTTDPRWSPDGKWISFAAIVAGRRGVYGSEFGWR